MRLLYFADTRFPLERANGIQTFETCHALARRGHAVHLVVRRDPRAPERDAFAFYGAPRHDLFEITGLSLPGSTWVRRAAYVATALELTSRRDADVVFTRDLGVASALLRLPRVLRPPLVYESHGHAAIVGAHLGEWLTTATRASSLKQRRLLRRERFVWSAADGCITITRALGDELARRFGARSHLAVVPDGARVDPSASPPPLPPPGPFVAGYAGHLYPWKGVDVLVRALAEADGVEGLIVGGHPDEPDIARVRALADTLGIGARVRFTGLLPPAAVPALLAAAHVLVLPNTASAISSAYTSPLKLFEYLAAGRAIVASDLPAFREVLADGEHALLVPPGDPSALAAALSRLRVDPGLAGRLARNAFSLAPDYSWDARARRIEAVVAGLPPRRRPPG
jgi:glycosyltransferase involved in cell wall biosynthesis